MLTQILNVHHSKIPKVGEVGYMVEKVDRFRGNIYFGKKAKWQCMFYALTDNVRPFSIGIHTAFFKNLGTGEIKQFSGFYFQSLN